MPGLPLVVITSPLLMGQPAAHIAAAPIAHLPEVSVASRQIDTPQTTLISSNWSLIAVQGTTSGLPAGEDQPEVDTWEDEPMNEIVVQGAYGPAEGDPMERMNADTFRITQDVDRAVVAPLAYAYEDGLPGPLRDGLHNAVRNLSEPSNALNFLLQLKVGKAFETLGRFAINSTLGIGGLFDIAGEPGIGLPYRRNGFANTLGYYGVGSGPYLVLPLAGSTSVRDVIGNGLDGLLLPTVVGGPFRDPAVGIPLFTVSSLQSRLEIDEQLERINSSDDPYATMRDGYLAQRKATIQEFRDGSPLQGIPDADRPDGERLMSLANDPAPDLDETNVQDQGADRITNLDTGGLRYAPGEIVLVQTRKSHPTR
ncbi:VacJ family lipoprotein [uncultured Erythrobacter sp.]|uniref:MlaA family lipoprotein n=1 Tax=uncultured Erythrobacter sp. TaxID=263913 RepID=UPI002636B653|nr:VacJ family lipoprotein [uncultured Erythrobacter sp.]